MNFERLYLLREKAELTQEEMGNIVGTKKYSISKWEKGKEIIPLQKLNAYANFFNVSMDYILNLDDYCHASNKPSKLDAQTIGNNIKKIREEYHLSQRELAKVLNTTHSAIWAYEKGKNLVLTAFAYQICTKYNVSLDWLCGRIEKKIFS